MFDRDSKEIAGVHIGRHDYVGVKGLWHSLPPVYRQCAACYTDFWAAYNEILPTKRHRIERFNLTMRQRVSRLVRKALSFSKKLENYIGAIWNFIHHYNLEIAPGLSKISTY